MKNECFDALIKQMSKCQKCLNMHKGNRDCSLINIFEDSELCKNIPSIWTDWYNRLDASIMIIGQDWGPIGDMQKLNQDYLRDKTYENWVSLRESEKSLTKKMLTKYLLESAKLNNKIIDEKYMDNIYITNAIMCARQGSNYRGDNIKLKECTLNCREYLKRQIDIVKPKVIITLGYYPLYALSLIFGFKMEESLKKMINLYEVIKVDDYAIIPCYHPVAQVKKEEQLRQYKKINDYM